MKLTPKVHSQSLRDDSHGRDRRVAAVAATPALLQTTWTLPNVENAASASRFTCSSDITSVRTASTRAPFALIADSAIASGSLSMSARTTLMPSSAKRCANARPMPLAAPVTTATRSLNSFILLPRPYRADLAEVYRLLSAQAPEPGGRRARRPELPVRGP